MEIILQRILKQIEIIYDDSMYSQTNDLYRIKDLIHSVDYNQILSKRWLITELLNIFNPIKNKHNLGEIPKFIIGGGWYGLMAYLLREKFENSLIINVDMDPVCLDIGSKIYHDQDIGFEQNDVVDYGIDCDIFVSTSVEHFDKDDFKFLLKSKPKHTICALQSNDWEKIDSHINCHKTLDDFINYLSLKEVLYKGEIKINNEYSRFTVIGW